jgi:M6 family metalloprotease-like protein
MKFQWIPSLLAAFLAFAPNTQAHALTTWMGKQRALVLPMFWEDHPATHPEDKINRTFFQPQAPSLRQFFLENSVGKFDLTGSVMKWRQVPMKWNASRGCDPRWISDLALKLFGPDIPVSQFDSDGNGKIDNLFIVHSARIPHDRVGPNCVFTETSVADHTVVFQSEGLGSIGSDIPVGFYIHEAGHGYFRFPDLYGDHYHGRYGIGMWGMMGLGAWGVDNRIPRADLFRYPAHFEPLSKIEIGWVKPRVISQSQTGVSLRPIEASGDVVAIPVSGGVSYLVEFRSPLGFSHGHRGHGLLIWKNYKIMQADGRDDLNNGNNLGYRPLPPIGENFGDSSDPFPGSGQVRFFRDPRSGIALENIVYQQGRISFDVVISNRQMSIPFTRLTFPKFDGRERL